MEIPDYLTERILATRGALFLLRASIWFVPCFLSLTVDAQAQAKTYRPVEVFANQRLDRPVRAVVSAGNYYVLDARGHRVIMLDSAERFVRQIGRFGTGPEELSDPSDLAIGLDGKIHVFEAGNKRLTIFDGNGKRVGGFSAPELSLGVATNSKNEIILNQPAKGSLLTAYGQNGTVRASFGALHNPPSGLGVHAPHDPKQTYNRVSFSVDSSDNIYAAWWFEPRVQKYNRAGEMVWDVELAGREVDALKEKARTRKGGYYKYNGATIILSGVVYDSSSDLIYVLFPSRALYILDKEGKMLGEFVDPQKNVWPFSSITVAEGGKLLFTDTFQHVYSVSAPKP